MRTVRYDVPGVYTYTVPAGVTELLNVDIVGGQGGQGVTTDNGSGAEGTGVPGGNGATTLGTIANITVAGEGRSGGGETPAPGDYTAVP